MSALAKSLLDAGNVSVDRSSYGRTDLPNGGVPLAEFVALEEPSGQRVDQRTQASLPRPNVDYANRGGAITKSAAVIDVGAAFRGKVVGKRTMHTLQEWEGVVDSIGTDKFHAQLRDITSARNEKEFAQIPINLVERGDRAQLKEGAIFRFIVGVAVTDKGNRINDAVIYFRKLRGENVGAEVAELIRSFPED